MTRREKMTNNAEPVSYTHLDVYKRQVLDPGRVKKDGGSLRYIPGSDSFR